MTLFTYIMTYELQVSNYHALLGDNTVHLRHLFIRCQSELIWL